MKLFSLNETPYEPVSHNPELKKKVLARDELHCVRNISHIILQPGNSVSEHSHSDFVEVFYCIRGKALFLVKGETVSVKKGHLLFIEPGEPHSIPEIIEETEFLYFHTPSH
ncbi:MAG: cupin domain-containing protein [Nitrospirota bacterium]